MDHIELKKLKLQLIIACNELFCLIKSIQLVFTLQEENCLLQEFFKLCRNLDRISHVKHEIICNHTHVIKIKLYQAWSANILFKEFHQVEIFLEADFEVH